MKTMRIISWVFPIVGVLLLVGALLLWSHSRQFVASAHTAQGTVVELIESRDSDGSTYKPVVRFTAVDGREVTYTESFSGNPPPYEVGETVEVLFNTDKPHKARIKGFMSLWLGSTILGGMGLIFAAIGGGIFFASVSGRRKKNYLMAYGNAIQTDLQGVDLNTSLEINGRNPWRITSQWLDPLSNKMRVFHSENLWFDPTEFVTARQVTVLLDPKNPKRYYMDVSFLPEMEGG